MSIQQTTAATIYQRPDLKSELYVPSHQVGIDEQGTLFAVSRVANGVFLHSFQMDQDSVNRLAQLKYKKEWETEDKIFVQKCLDKYFPLRALPEVETEIARRFDSNYTIVNSAKEGHIGRSGDRIYFVKDTDGKIIAIAKALITHRRDQQYETQLRGINEFAKLQIEGTTPIRCLSSYKGEKFHLLILTPALGEVQEQLFKQLDTNPSIINKLKDTFVKVGRVYARLHAHQQTPVKQIPAEEAKEYFSVWKQCRSILESHPLFADIDLKAMDEHLEQLYKDFEKNPGKNCNTHGDPHPGNWFFDAATEKVALIDLGHLSPNGYPANELHAVHSCLAYHSFLYGMEGEKAKELQESFSQGYFASVSKKDYATDESQCYFHSYWGMLNMRDRLQKDPKKYENYIRNMLAAIKAKNTLYKY